MYPLGAQRQLGALGMTPAGGAYLLPSQGPGQTAEWDASKWATSLYTDAGVTLCTAENDQVYRIGDVLGTRHLNRGDIDTARGLLKLNVQNGLAGVLLDGINDWYTTGLPTSTFWANNAKTIYIVAKVVSVGTDSGTVYANDPLFSDNGGWWGIFMRSSGALYHYNYDGTIDFNTLTISSGESVVLCARHNGVDIKLNKNNTVFDSDASGNTSNMSTYLQLGRRQSTGDFSNVYFFQASTHNQYHDDATMTSIVNGLKTKWGIA